MKKLEISILIGVLISIVASNLLPFVNKCEKLKNEIIRIHIVANSNLPQDQLLKLKVKDNISLEVSKLMKNVKNKNKAKNIILDNLNYISEISKKEIIKNGKNYSVNTGLVKSYFPTKKYENFILPAGEYDALKVVIGNGIGKNWWCVAFPPMCNPIYFNKKNVQTILGKSELEIIEGNYEYKFALLELFSNLTRNLMNK